ncbi:hypothetical protein AVEN_39493-1 [Araneus ventricosus]|uniref:Uncharacterized protein n=1 Tax=Araneus ventricosus TaxID=182803 RepID=A0A4Y2D5W4_ARAVE|nr:hypothetical protein AVEN_39493-1 [Araneus ventricosus]
MQSSALSTTCFQWCGNHRIPEAVPVLWMVWMERSIALKISGTIRLVRLAFRFEEPRELFGSKAALVVDLVILNGGQMTRKTPEPATPLRTSAPHQRDDVLPLMRDLMYNRSTYAEDV